MRSAQKQIAKDGLIKHDRFGQPRPHVLLTVERDARFALMSALKQLGLDPNQFSKSMGVGKGTRDARTA
jgi:hypothetical protein